MQNTLAFVFPGQGSQAVSMLADFADDSIVQDTFKEASDALGYDVWALIAEGPAEKLNQTNYTQPALLTASVALWRLLTANSDNKPSTLAGHSLGEYSALVCANVLELGQAVKLVQKRGEFMRTVHSYCNLPSSLPALSTQLDTCLVYSLHQRSPRLFHFLFNFSPNKNNHISNLIMEQCCPSCGERYEGKGGPGGRLPVIFPCLCRFCKACALKEETAARQQP